MNKLNIIFRTCDVVDSIHGTGRPFGLTKKEVVEAKPKKGLVDDALEMQD